MSNWLVIWSNKKAVGNNVTLFDTEDESMEFVEVLKNEPGKYSVIVCKVVYYDGSEVKTTS